MNIFLKIREKKLLKNLENSEKSRNFAMYLRGEGNSPEQYRINPIFNLTDS